MDDLRRMAENGDVLAQLCYGLMCQHGHGLNPTRVDVQYIPQSKKEAARWYRRAASQGNVWGKYNLASISENRVEALQMCQEAAMQGLAEAQVALAAYYRTGGIFGSYSDDYKLEIDLIESYRWSLLAKEQNHPYMTNTNWFEILEDRMTPQQISKAKQLAAENL